ncbi:hypothetical protein LMG28688_07193 [Paraburkholderia caffeinitolerans]|uniref:Uncharacterized protein n=1 Tax=Paraburkholderia caffeinitolerans TaxID=1723730 RepID=A0A6J5H2S0_9BURK|nr:hypothetical protein LMG28688_07193 [Paraburkholderia caffeinitolerans]
MPLLWPNPMVTPMLPLDPLFVPDWLAVFRAASRFTLPSASSVALLPALISLPTTLMLLFAPAPEAAMTTLFPAARVLPAAVLEFADEWLLLWLVPNETFTPMPPACVGSLATASQAFLPARPVVAAASASSRGSPFVCFTSLRIWFAVCAAASTGLLIPAVIAVWLNDCCWFWLAVLFAASTVTVLPARPRSWPAYSALPVTCASLPAEMLRLPLTAPIVLALFVTCVSCCASVVLRTPKLYP